MAVKKSADKKRNGCRIEAAGEHSQRTGIVANRGRSSCSQEES